MSRGAEIQLPPDLAGHDVAFGYASIEVPIYPRALERLRTEEVDAEYTALPLAVRLAVSFREWLWMGAEQRARLVDDICEPDFDEGAL